MITAIILTLDKRLDLSNRLAAEAKDCGMNVFQFIVGDGSQKDITYNWTDVDIPPNTRWGYSAVGHVKNHYNAFKCHQEMAKIGLNILNQNENNQILFLEDDAKILVDRFLKYKHLIDCQCHTQKDIIYLGYWTGRENDIEIERVYEDSFIIERLNQPIGGLHGAILGRSALEAIINMEPIDPVDSQLNRSNLRRYLTKPKLITTVNTYSFTEGINIERDYL